VEASPTLLDLRLQPRGRPRVSGPAPAWTRGGCLPNQHGRVTIHQGATSSQPPGPQYEYERSGGYLSDSCRAHTVSIGVQAASLRRRVAAGSVDHSATRDRLVRLEGQLAAADG
jgi:hypothetical protein